MEDRPYPILMDLDDQLVLARLARLIPNGGVAVEIGSRLGGSAKLILENAPADCHLTCFDLEWTERDVPGAYCSMREDEAMFPLAERWRFDEYDTTWQFANRYLSDHPNVTLVPANAPYDIVGWDREVDWVLEDSSHYNPQLRDNIEFWWRWLKPGGIMLGHDFGVQPQVDVEARSLADSCGSDLSVEGTIWWLRKPSP